MVVRTDKIINEDHIMNLMAFQLKYPLNWRAFAEISCYNMYTKARPIIWIITGKVASAAVGRQMNIARGEL